MSGAAEFRGSGRFRIDRAKALEKLSAFSLERGTDFLLPLARCAAAAGARLLTVKGQSALKAAFDGVPFTREELADPYGALFAEDADSRNRHFAAFLLGVLRTKPREVVVASGPPDRRFRLRAADLRAETVEPDDRRDVGTAVHVRWGPLRGFRAAGPAKAAARAAWVLTPRGFTVDGSAASEPASAQHLVNEDDRGGLRLRLRPPEDPAETLITFCSFGVAIETIKTVLPDVQVRAWVNDDAFTLTASQAAVVEDARRQKALDAVGAATAGFLAEAARRLSEAFPEGRPAPGGPAWADEARSWFSAAVRRLAAEGRPAPDALWRTPFLADAAGRALSLANLRRSLSAGGKAAYSLARAAGAKLPMPVAYCPRAADRALLESVFPGALHDATQLIESLARLK